MRCTKSKKTCSAKKLTIKTCSAQKWKIKNAVHKNVKNMQCTEIKKKRVVHKNNKTSSTQNWEIPSAYK